MRCVCHKTCGLCKQSRTMLNRQTWTFVKLRPQPAATGGQAAAAVSAAPTWALAVVAVLGVGAVVGVGVGTAAAAGAFASPATPATPVAPSPPPPSPPPPYNSDDASAACSNDCGGCGQNGGCTYSYGADEDPNTKHDSRAYQSNGVCDDGGEGSTLSVCDFGSDCHDCGVRQLPPPPPPPDS